MNPSLIMSFVVTMVITALLIPIVMKIGAKLGIVAHKNKRTVHKVEVPRIGGYAIYISSLIGMVIFLKTDPQINAILIASFLVFFVGLFDDVHDLSPKTKLIVELIAALIVILYGDIYLKGFDFLPANWPPILPGAITVLWIVGITNAINLIDGLDGLSIRNIDNCFIYYFNYFFNKWKNRYCVIIISFGWCDNGIFIL